MKRSITKTGRAFTVTLPAKWVRENNLEQYKELEVTQRGKSMVFQPPEEWPEEIEIKADGNLVNLKSQLMSFYIRGVDRITIIFNGHDNVLLGDTISDEVHKHLHCMEIDERDDKKCVIKSFYDTTPMALNKVLRKSFYSTLESMQKCAEALRTADKNLVEQIFRNHADVKRFCFYALRLLNKDNNVNQHQIIAYTRAIDKITETSNHIRHIAKHHAKQKHPKKTVEAMQAVYELLSLAHNAFYDVSRVNEFFDYHQKIRKYYYDGIIDKQVKENFGIMQDLAMNLVRQSLIINYKSNSSN